MRIISLLCLSSVACGGAPFLEERGLGPVPDAGSPVEAADEPPAAQSAPDAVHTPEVGVSDAGAPDVGASEAPAASPDARAEAAPEASLPPPADAPADAPAAVPEAGGAPADACGVEHRSSGLPGSWITCYPLSTYTALSAADACGTYRYATAGSTPCFSSGCAADGTQSVCTTPQGGVETCWVFSGAGGGNYCVGGPCASDCTMRGTWD